MDHNRTDSSVDLDGWAFTDGIRFRFDRSSGPTSIVAKGFLLVAKDPAVVGGIAGIPPTAIAGPYAGKLSNVTDRIVLVDQNRKVVDVVEYVQDGAWPACADGLGSSLQRVSSEAPGNLPQNWSVVVAAPPARAPSVRAPTTRGAPREESATDVLRGLLDRFRDGPAPPVPGAVRRSDKNPSIGGYS